MTESNQQPPQDYSPKQRLRIVLILLIVTAILLFLAWQIVSTAQTLFLDSPWIRAAMFSLAVLIVALPIYLIAVMLHRKCKTGRFLLSPAESAAQRARIHAKMGAGKPFLPQAKYWSGLIFLLVLCGIGATAAIVAAIKLCGCPDTHGIRILLLSLAAVCLFPPGLVLFGAIRRKRKTGYYLPSQEDLAAARAKCGMPKPLWQRILLPVMFSINGVLYTTSALSHNHIGHTPSYERWALAAVWWLLTAVWIMQAFRPSTCAIQSPPDTTPSPS